jgi:hypothetical protein
MRSSRLGLSWANGDWLAGCPQVKRVLTTRSGRRGSVFGAGRDRGGLAVPVGVVLGDVEAEGFEFGDEFAEPFVVVEPGGVIGELVVGQDLGRGSAVFLAGPLVVGAVGLRGVGAAAAAGVSTAGEPVGDGAGQGAAGGAGEDPSSPMMSWLWLRTVAPAMTMASAAASPAR